MKTERFFLSMLLFLFFLSLTGCGRDELLQPSEEAQVQDKTIRWNATHSSMSEQYEAVTINDDKIYACRFGGGGMGISVFSTDTVRQTAAFEIPGAVELKSISVDASEQICVFGSTADGDTLWKVSPDGDINVIEDIRVEDLGEQPQLKNFYADSSGHYYLWYEMSVPCAEIYEDGEEDVYTRLDRIYVKDQQMNTIIYEQVPDSYGNKLINLAFDGNGIPVLLAKDEEGYYVQRVRTAQGESYEPDRLETNGLNDLEGSGMIAYTQDGLLYTREGALRLYHMSDSRDEKLLELASIGIREADIIYLGMRDGIIEIIDNYEGAGQSEYTAVKEGESRKTQLTLGVMTIQPQMAEIIAAFNRCQNEVAIEPVVYADDYDYDAGYEKLTLDVIRGRAPDLISTDGIRYESLAEAGAFADLYSFMQRDTELNAGSLVSGVLKVYELEGHLYTIAPSFLVYTMWGAGSMVEGLRGIDAEEMIRLLCDNGGDINSIYGFSADENVLTTLCAFNMDKFIDWGSLTCDFTGKEFQSIISFAREYKGVFQGSLYQAVQNGDILLTLGLITSVEDYCLESELYGEKVQFIGYPTESGTGSAAFFSGDKLAISSGSGHQEEAWQFIKFFVENGYNGSGFPLIKEQFDEILNESMEEEMVYEDGEPCRIAKRSYTEPDIISIQIYKCEPEDVEAIRELVDSISDKFQYHTEIQKIIDEEAEAYLQDQKGMEEVCSIIQSRIQLYLNES